MYFTVMYELTVESSFSAAHRLENYRGLCEKLHGHNWLVRATVRCETLDESGIGMDFRLMKRYLGDIVNDFDHSDLNALLHPLSINPSSENIARYIFEKLEKTLEKASGTVARVEVFETPGSCAAYFR